MSEVLPNLFVGTTSNALDDSFLAEKNIMHVISCGLFAQFSKQERELQVSNKESDGYWITPASDCIKGHWVLPMKDHGLPPSRSTLLAIFAKTSSFIQSRLSENEAVLIHCKDGISRSPAVVCAFLVRNQRSEPIKYEELARVDRFGKPVIKEDL